MGEVRNCAAYPRVESLQGKEKQAQASYSRREEENKKVLQLVRNNIENDHAGGAITFVARDIRARSIFCRCLLEMAGSRRVIFICFSVYFY